MRHFSFDFDSCLGKVSAEVDYKMMSEIANYTGVGLADIIIAAESLNQEGYSLDAHLRLLRQFSDSWELSKIHDLVTDMLRQEFRGILYNDTEPILNELRNRGNSLSIITFGDPHYQDLKLEATGLKQLVDVTLITPVRGTKPQAMAGLIQKYHLNAAHVTYIDDKLYELRAMHEAHPQLELFQICRGGIASTPESEGNGSEFKKITELSILLF